MPSGTAKIKEPFRASWVKKENLHLTLNFLGVIDPPMVGQIITAMEEAATGLAPFSVTLGELKRVPNINKPKTLWLGINEGAGLERLRGLKERLDRELRSIGFEVEGRTYRPHLTLCRIRNSEDRHTAGKRVSKLIKEHRESQLFKKEIDFTMNSFVLFSSRLGSGAAIHTPIFTAKLKTPGL